MRVQFAKAVRQRRLKLGLSQEELAWRAGLHRTYLAGIEAGSRNPSLQSIARLARALDVSLSALFGEIKDSPEPTSSSRAGALPGRLVEILLVEDNPRDVEMTRRAMTKIGLANPLHVARDGAEALDYIFGRGAFVDRALEPAPKVILLDLKLPKVDGLEVLRQIKSDIRTSTIPVAVLSASHRDEDVAESRRLGAEAYIVKPVDFEGLSSVVPQLRLHWALLETNQTRPGRT